MKNSPEYHFIRNNFNSTPTFSKTPYALGNKRRFGSENIKKIQNKCEAGADLADWGSVIFFFVINYFNAPLVYNA